MPPTFRTQLVTQQGVLFDGEAEAVLMPGVEGYFGVLAHHAPLIAELGIGDVVASLPDGRSQHFSVAGGVCEVRDNKVVLLIEVGEVAEEIDVERAQAAAERARQRLAGEGREEDVDLVRAQVALGRALNRLSVSPQGDI